MRLTSYTFVRRLLPATVAIFAFAGAAEALTDTFTVSGNWVAPAGVTSVTVEVWGGGGAGGGNPTNRDGGGGGGGGGYSSSTIAVVPGNSYTVVVGAGGTGVVGGNGTVGGQSFFINAATVQANGGAGGAVATAIGGTGGAGAVLGVGTTRFAGGNGGQGRDNNTGRGGPGGSSAGTGANGTNGPTPYGGTGMVAQPPPPGGGIGGNGAQNADGFAPASGYGGGGGGSGDTSGPGGSRSGGNGAGGRVLLTYAGGSGGCTSSTVGSETVHICTGNGTITIPAGVSTVRYLVVAGGGGGGGIDAGNQDGAGGGGAGGVLSGTGFTVTPGNYNVVVGSGGAAGTGATNGGNGGDSTFSSLTAIGGGGGAREGGQDGLDGGSGGGGSDNNNGGSGTAGQGNDGGDGNNNDGGGGGGGAGGVGQQPGGNDGGNGGAGIVDNITGGSLGYGGGGGGGADDGATGGAGGAGGGATAPTGRGPGVAGTANTGGGGSGATGDTNGGGAAFSGGAGGSGIVIIRYTLGGVVAEYRLDEAAWNGTPGEVLDSSTNALHGRAVGGAVPVPALVCNGAQLNIPPAAQTAYIEVADDPLLDITTALTVTAWVRPSVYPGAGALMTVASKDTNWEFHITSSGQVNWWWNTGAAALTTGAGAVPLNIWTHIAITFRQGQQIVYINGVASATGTDGAALFTNNLPIQIGDDQGFGGGSRRFRGLIDEVQIHNTTLSAAGVIAVMNTTRPCASTVNHYYVQNGASGVNCQAESITITAHDVAHAATSAALRTITITAARIAGAPGTHGDFALTTGTGTLLNGVVDDGVATYTFGAAETQVVLSYKNTWIQTVNISVSDGTASDLSGTVSADVGYNQDIAFASSGFRFVDGSNNAIPNQVAGVSAGPYQLQAIQTGAGGCGGFGPCPGVCTVPGAFAAGQVVPIDVAFRCDDPITCQPLQQVSITNNGTDPIAANPASGVVTWTTKNILFGANGVAAFDMVYPDVGAISLHARYYIPLGDGSPSVNLMTGSSNGFVVSPFGFVVETTVPNEIKRTSDAFVNPAAATAAGPMFIRAGDDFSVTVTSINFAGTATPNYGQEIAAETVRLTANLVALPGLTNNPALTNPTAFGAFTGGRATGTTFSWAEVGIITLTPSVADANYLGAGDVTGTTSGNVGRFVPFDFAVTRNAPLFDPGCSAAGKDPFTYIGEPFFYQIAPVITVTARNRLGGTTQNYSADFFRITSVSLTGKTYNPAGALDVSGISGTDPVIRYNGDAIAVPPPPPAGTGTLTFSAGTGLLFTRTNPLVAFDADISLAINVLDDELVPTTVALIDGVAGSNPVSFGQAIPGNGIPFAGTSVTVGKTPREMRFGRLRMDNVSGTTRLGLPLRIQAQYYTANGFVTNGDDSCTSFDGADIAMTFVGNLIACETAIAPSGALTLIGGKVSGLQLAAPGVGVPPNRNDGGVDLVLNLGAPSGDTCTAIGGPTSTVPVTSANLDFLQGNWGGLGTWNQDPRARATFGLYNNAAEFLYLQENY